MRTALLGLSTRSVVGSPGWRKQLRIGQSAELRWVPEQIGSASMRVPDASCHVHAASTAFQTTGAAREIMGAGESNEAGDAKRALVSGSSPGASDACIRCRS